MRQLLLLAFLAGFLNGFGQEAQKTEQIDSIVKSINASTKNIYYDSVFNETPYGVSSKTYITVIMDSTELKKYSQRAIITNGEKDKVKITVGENTFYFQQDKLIKVEESMNEGNKEFKMDWYYVDEKPLSHTTIQKIDGKPVDYQPKDPEKIEERATFLIRLAGMMREKVKPAAK